MTRGRRTSLRARVARARMVGAAIAVGVAFSACQRVEEPPVRPTAGDTGVGASSGGAGAASGRCVRPTPAAPAPAAAPAALCPKDPDGAPPALARATVEFVEAAPLAVDVEVARTPEETSRGLMYRTEMAEGRGMLFKLGSRRDQSFWMHNTCLPLDMLFVDEDGLIVGILENVPTLNDEARSVGCPSTHVLEVNAGWTRRHGVKAGQKLLLPAQAR